MRIDELARRAGVATTTVRLYQRKGLLPGPRLEGRTGWYGPAHLDRLRVIARLQAEGHSLAGIGRLVARWEEGGDLADLIAPDAGPAPLFGAGREVVLDPAELAARLPAEAVTPAAMARAVEVGLVEPTADGQVRVPDARFLDTGPALIALGVPVEVVLDEWAALAERTDAIAERFLALFEDHLLPDGLDLASLAPSDLPAVAQPLGRLHHLAGQVVQAALDASLARLARARLGALADAAGASASDGGAGDRSRGGEADPAAPRP